LQQILFQLFVATQHALDLVACVHLPPGPIVVPYVVAIKWGALLTCSLDSRSATELGNIVFDVPPAKFTL
jgi:hypothetical protein